jgi:HlyD family secretion protein
MEAIGNPMLKLENTFRLAAWGVLVFFALSVCVSAFKLPGAGLLERSSSLFKRVSPAPETVLPAKIEPLRLITVASDYTGVLTALPAATAKEIKEGELLAVVHSDELAADRQRAERRLELAKQRYAFAKSLDAGQANKQIHNEELAVAKMAAQTANERLNSYSVAELEKSYADAQRRVQDVKDLLQQKLATEYEYDEALNKERSEFRNLSAGREHLSRLRQEADLGTANLRMLQIKSGRGTVDVQSAEIEMRDAAESLSITEQRLAKCQIRARMPGTVLQVMARTGDTVAAGSPLLQIADLTVLTFEAPVTATIARSLFTGMQVTVRVPTDPPARVAAKITSVSAAPDPAKQAYLVKINVPNPDPSTILAGLEGAVEFRHKEQK